MTYQEYGRTFDISSAGRGAQQTLLLFAYLYANPNAILLLDEPDAHLEILRQRQIYNRLVAIAQSNNSQVIAASHSEVVLNEAASRDVVVAFVGTPHELTAGQPSQVLKALRDIGFDHYYSAEQKGWVLYLEDTTDLLLLRAFTEVLGNKPALQALDAPFVHYLATNLPQKARDHFQGLREAKPDLIGCALFDRLDRQLQSDGPLVELTWKKREIENYLCTRDVLIRYAESQTSTEGPLFEEADRPRRREAMEEAITELENALLNLGRPSPWSDDTKVSDDFLEPLFKNYSKKLGIPLCLRKRQYSNLVFLMSPGEIDPEVSEKLEIIASIAHDARPTSGFNGPD
ncbi:MAG: AAA family ATPase [Syntrophales bacterium]